MAEAARDFVVDGAPRPWALEMYHECTLFSQFPRPGGWHEQDDLEMSLMQLANRAASVYAKAGTGQEITPEDADFMVWLEEDE